MRVEHVDTGGEGALIVFHLRAGIGWVYGLCGLGVAFTVLAIVTANVEWLFLAAVWGISGLFTLPIVRWLAWSEEAVSLTSTSIRPLVGRDLAEPAKTIDRQEGTFVRAAPGLTLTDSDGKKTKFHNVEYGDQNILAGLHSRYEARQIAVALNAAIAAET